MSIAETPAPIQVDIGDFLVPITTIIVALLGGGGVVAWVRANHDHKIGVAQQEAAEDDALSARWESLIRAQTESLIKPLQEQVASLTTKVDELDESLRQTQRRYWKSITYIRTLLTWVGRNLPHGSSTPPDPPEEIQSDI